MCTMLLCGSEQFASIVHIASNESNFFLHLNILFNKKFCYAYTYGR